MLMTFFIKLFRAPRSALECSALRVGHVLLPRNYASRTTRFVNQNPCLNAKRRALNAEREMQNTENQNPETAKHTTKQLALSVPSHLALEMMNKNDGPRMVGPSFSISEFQRFTVSAIAFQLLH
jgi:hypothetical protein